MTRSAAMKCQLRRKMSFERAAEKTASGVPANSCPDHDQSHPSSLRWLQACSSGVIGLALSAAAIVAASLHFAATVPWRPPPPQRS